MKRLLITTLGLALISATSAQAATYGDGFFFKPNIGADYQYTMINYKNNMFGTGVNGDALADDTLHGVNAHVGARIHKNIGVEVGYLWTERGEQNNVLGSGQDSKVDFRGFNVDALGYIPLTSSGNVELIGTLGVSRLKASYTIPTVATTSESETKMRFGGGAQLWLTDNTNLRALVRYQDTDFAGTVDNMITGTVGLNFQF